MHPSAEGCISFRRNSAEGCISAEIPLLKDAFPSAEIQSILPLKGAFPSAEILPLGDAFPSVEMHPSAEGCISFRKKSAEGCISLGGNAICPFAEGCISFSGNAIHPSAEGCFLQRKSFCISGNAMHPSAEGCMSGRITESFSWRMHFLQRKCILLLKDAFPSAEIPLKNASPRKPDAFLAICGFGISVSNLWSKDLRGDRRVSKQGVHNNNMCSLCVWCRPHGWMVVWEGLVCLNLDHAALKHIIITSISINNHFSTINMIFITIIDQVCKRI